MNFYEFRYGYGKKTIANYLSILSNIIYPFLIVFVLKTILMIFGLIQKWPVWVTPALYGIALIASITAVVIYKSELKGVLVADEYIEINRYYSTTFHPIPNFKIRYKDIRSIRSSRTRIPNGTLAASRHLVGGGDLDYYVEIVLKSGKVYTMPVEDQEVFVSDVNERMKRLSEKK